MDYNAINFRNKDVDKMSGKFNKTPEDKTPGPIKAAINTIKVNREFRADEKQRAENMGYKYDRNIIHTGEGKAPMSLKGSVGAAVASGMREKKKDISKTVAKVGDKIKEAREAAEYRKGAKANDDRAKSNRVKSTEYSNIKGGIGFENLKDILHRDRKVKTQSNNRKASDNRQIRKQMNRSSKNRIQ